MRAVEDFRGGGDVGMRGEDVGEVVEAPAGRLNANQEIVAHSLGEVRSFLEELKHGTKKYRTIAS